jgi:hypothetical protein
VRERGGGYNKKTVRVPIGWTRGSFAIARAQGPPPGSYRVRVYSSSGRQAPPDKGQSERTRRPMVERLPDIYNTNSELQMEVVDGRSNRLQLHLHGEGGNRPDPGRPCDSRPDSPAPDRPREPPR